MWETSLCSSSFYHTMLTETLVIVEARCLVIYVCFCNQALAQKIAAIEPRMY